MVVVVQGRSACAHRMTERRPRPSWPAPSASRHRTSTCWSRGARPNGRCCWLPCSRKTSPSKRTPCWCSRRPEDGSLQCAFLLTPSDAPPVSFFRMVRGGLLQLLLQWGLGPVGRLLRAKAWHERSYAEALGTRPHLVLERMAVSKNQRGGGIGTATLAGALAVDADAKGLPVVLTTQEARNVRFYRRLGFEVALEEEFPPGITNTIMVREPTL